MVNSSHASRTFFLNAFGMDAAPDIGGHACAMAGSIVSTSGIVPIEMSNDIGPCWEDDPGSGNPNDTLPLFGELCPIEGGAHDPNPRGILDLEATSPYCSDANGSGDIEDMIADGASGSCRIHANPSGGCSPVRNGPWFDCVAVQTGNTANILDGFNTRLLRETGDCDTDGDGIENFDEVVTVVFNGSHPSDDVYEANDCDFSQNGVQPSPRLITIIVLESEPGPGNRGLPIIAFAGMYVSGCWESNDEPPADVTQDDLDPYCDRQGGSIVPALSGFSKLAAPPLHHCTGQNAQHPACTPTRTPTRTNTPGPTATRTPTPIATATLPPNPTSTPGGGGGGGGGGTGQTVVFANFVNLLVTGGEVGEFDPQTTLTGIGLVE
jgi:hypothetical protein